MSWRDEVENCLFELQSVRSEALDRLAALARQVADENVAIRKENWSLREAGTPKELESLRRQVRVSEYRLKVGLPYPSSLEEAALNVARAWAVYSISRDDIDGRTGERDLLSYDVMRYVIEELNNQRREAQ